MAGNQDVEKGDKSCGEEIRAPLLAENGGEKQLLKKGIKEERFMVYVSTFVAVCGSYAFGSCAGFSSPTQFAIIEDASLSIAEYSLFGSILTFGAMIGAITSGKIADYMGRKGAMIVSSGFCTAGWLSIYFAEGALLLDIGRLATGYGMGVFSFVVPIFIAEIAPKDLRGALTTLNQLMITAGVSVSFIIGTLLTWRTLALVGIVPCAVLLVGLSIIPESPRWLAKQGRQKEFEASLHKLRGKNADISAEAAEIQDYIETLERLPKARLMDLFQKRYMSSVTIGVGLMVCQQFGGINGVCFYTSSIFESAGFPADIGTIIYAILQVIITALGALFIDRAGRKPLLVVSGAGLVLGCLLTGSSFFVKESALQNIGGNFEDCEMEKKQESKRQSANGLVDVWSVQCGECFKWRLISTEEEFEEIRSKFTDDPFVCSKKPGVSCDDPADIERDASRIWVSHKPDIPKTPAGFKRRLVMRKDFSKMDCYYDAPNGKRLRASSDVPKFLDKYPDYAKEVSTADFSFSIPRVLEDTVPSSVGKKTG